MTDSTPPVAARRRTPPTWLRALGRDELPPRVTINGRDYERAAVFKHDFFAATGLYTGATGKIIVKLGRTAPLLGAPMTWLGRASARREETLYTLLADLPGLPRWLGRIGATGFAHEYVEGHPLRKGECVNDDFFPRLERLLRDVHARRAAYVDLEKRENILVGDDGRPYLIDFQISWYVRPERGGCRWPWRVVQAMLQRADRYHLLKHKRRHRPDQLSAEERRDDAAPPWVRLHRLLFRPFTLARRRVLTWLGARSGARGRSEELRDEPTAA